MEGGKHPSGVRAGEELLALAEAVVTGDEGAIAAARERVRRALGDAATVDAAAVIGNYERMVRIADGTGIPLDRPMALMTANLGAEIGIDRFATAANTPPVNAFQRMLGRGMTRMAPLVLWLLRARYRREG